MEFENVNVRIGSCFPEPTDARGLSTWLSYADLSELCVKATLAEKTGSCVIWGASNNARTFWRHDARDSIHWLPRNSADTYAAQMQGKVSASPIQERYQGGVYTTIDYSRNEPPPAALFAK